MEELKKYIDYSQQIKEFYKKYNINVDIPKIIDSYSITRYFITLDRTNKTKMSNVEKLVDDLSVEISVKNIKFSIDFESGSIVLEVPKKNREMLYFKDLENSVDNKNGLNVSLGKDLNKKDFIIDLCKTPHLLIAGTTGSGKSMFLNTVLCNLLNTYKSEQLQLYLIDPKKVELSMYNHIQHVKDVATDLQQAKGILKTALAEINRRYKLLETNNVRNIDNYNKKVNGKLPYQLIVIDELADIIIQDKNNRNRNDIEMSLEDLIVRIAQIGRACGVHLIVATQRPSADVITGLIKANIPSRVAFSVSSKIDSRIILDEKGAEKLTGKGDMLVKIVGDEELHRLQGAYISDEEVEEITDKLRVQNSNIQAYLDNQTRNIEKTKNNGIDTMYIQPNNEILNQQNKIISSNNYKRDTQPTQKQPTNLAFSKGLTYTFATIAIILGIVTFVLFISGNILLGLLFGIILYIYTTVVGSIAKSNKENKRK